MVKKENPKKSAHKGIAQVKPSGSDYRTIYDSANEGIYIHEISAGRIIDANDAACKMFGYTRDELLKHTVEELSSGEPSYGQESAMSLILKAAAGEPQFFEWNFKRKTGETFWGEVNLKRIIFEGQDSVLAIVRDISERKAAEKVKSLLATIVESSHDAILSKTLDGIVTSWNLGAERIYGFKSKEIIGKHISVIIPPSRQDELSWILDNIRKGNRIDDHETIRRRKDGSIITVSLTIAPVFDSEGKVIGLSSIARDITEKKKAELELRKTRDELELRVQERTRELANANKALIAEINDKKRAENALRSSEEQLRVLINAMPDMVCFKDGEGRWIESNKSDLEFFGLEGVDYKGKTDLELAKHSPFYLDAFIRCYESDEKTWETGTTIHGEEMIPQPDGSVDVFDVIKVPLFHPDGSRRGLVVIGRDITERVEAEKALLKARDELEERVVDRTSELAEANKVLQDEIKERKRIEEAIINSERQLSDIINFLPDATFVVDSKGRVITWNRAIEEITSVSSASMLGKGEYEYSIPFYGERRPKLIDLVLNPDISVEEKYDYVNKQNSTLVAEVFIPDLKGGTYIWAKATPLYDSHGNVIGAIETIRDITEYKRAEQAVEAESKRLFSLLDSLPAFVYLQGPDHTIKFANKYFIDNFGEPAGKFCFQVLHDRENSSKICPTMEVFITKEPVSWEWTSDSGKTYQIYDYPFYDLDGSPLVLELGIDITERKRAEEELRDAKMQAELYLDLMAHDINNMNHVAMGYLEIANEKIELNDGDKPLISKPLEMMKNSSLLIDNVRKIQRAKYSNLRTDVIDLGKMLGDITQQYKDESIRGVSISYEPCCNCFVLANELLRDVFTNLIDNAIKHSDKHVKINIVLEHLFEGGNEYLGVYVEDNGPGIPDDIKEKIFGRLYKGPCKDKGSGIGLYLVNTLVTHFGGKVWVEDRVPGKMENGSRFVVILPSIRNVTPVEVKATYI
ncbi:hypothetical protein CUJ83_14950 [Methanocella sp. CWC-04]|uniref:histidine kinase n=1 Tax=Methanooceanicella nereidis TaxID=2052831 RepID=A0AAP2REL6_9EURY|nr:PAS domain S-box protein [Methanocella sp. CWC-04]MCD1296299.1 hypothetical protein [Methanocella sp. CWC-04]